MDDHTECGGSVAHRFRTGVPKAESSGNTSKSVVRVPGACFSSLKSCNPGVGEMAGQPSPPHPVPPDVGVEDELDLMVIEYLGHAGYDRAVSSMKDQLRERREGRPATWRPVGRDMQEHVKTKMLQQLDIGESEEVMQLWQNFVPPLLRHTDRSAQATCPHPIRPLLELTQRDPMFAEA